MRNLACFKVRLRMVVAVNERGRRVGETHYNAVISDALVDQMRELHEIGGLSFREISQQFNVALSTVRKIGGYRRRAQTAVRWKTIWVRKPKCEAKNLTTVPIVAIVDANHCLRCGLYCDPCPYKS